MEAGWLDTCVKAFRQTQRARSRSQQTASDVRLNMEWVAAAAGVHQAAERQLWRTVEVAHSSGCSWSQIGKALGVSGQAAHQRFTKPPRGQLL